MDPDDFCRAGDGRVKRDGNRRPILNSDLVCFSCKIVMAKVDGDERQCPYCGVREGYSPAEDAEAMMIFKDSLVGAVKSWFFDKCCKVRMHIYEEYESEDEKYLFGTLFGVPVETTVRYRDCTKCGKRQRSDWFTWRDVHEIPPARLINDQSK